MNKLGILLLTAAATAAIMVGCGDDETMTTSSSSSSSSGSSTQSTSSSASGTGGGTSDFGTMPTYGGQLDRLGRPAINTALNHAFDKNDATTDAAKDEWNMDSAADGWVKKYTAEIAKNLAIIDAVDGVCGNQLLNKKDGMPGAYDALASTLADDRLWLNTAGTTCTAYLAVEANATGILPNQDCGGRALAYDVIDTSYSVLAKGSIMGVDDGITKPSYVDGKTFPYLADPAP